MIQRRRLARNQQDLLNYVAAVTQTTPAQTAAAWPQMARSSVYGALGVLRAAGLLEAEWDCAGPHPVHVYRVTAAGQARL